MKSDKGNKIKYNVEKVSVYLGAWGIIPLVYLSWCFSTISYINVFYNYCSCAVGCLAAIIYAIVAYKMSQYEEHYAKQFDVLNYIILCLGILLLIVLANGYSEDIGIINYLTYCVWIVAALFGTVNCVKKRCVYKQSGMFMSFLLKRKYLLFLIVAVLIMYIYDFAYQFKWDGLLYYSVAREARLSSISSLALYGHISMFCGFMMRLLSCIFNDTGIGLATSNAIVLVMGIIAFYGTISCIVKNKSDFEYTLVTSLFAFSPFLFGLSGYYSTDFYCICMIPVLTWCVVKEAWIITTVVSVIFCATKEPALISYGGLCLGMIIYDFISIKERLRERLLYVAKQIRYYYMLIAILLWLLTYKMLGPWNAGDGGFGLDFWYIAKKLSVLLLFNWNWMFSILGCTMIAYAFYKDTKQLKWVIPFTCSNACLVIFNCVFQTANHPRYVDGFVGINLLFAAAFLLSLCGKKVERITKNGIVIFLVLLQVTACFYSFDPMTLALWDTEKIGNMRISHTADEPLGDSSIYNRQMLWLERPLNEAIAKSIEENNMIMLVNRNGAVNLADGMSQINIQTEKVIYEQEFWDVDKLRRVPWVDEHLDNAHIMPINVGHIMGGKTYTPIENDIGRISHIYVQGIAEKIEPEGYEYVKTETYEYRGWIINRDVYKKS